MVMVKRMSKRIRWIDIARGIAILFVIIGHSLGSYMGTYFANLIYVFHMPIFFILSGYLYHKRNPKKFLKSSWFNLLVPYIGTVIIAFVLLTFYLVHNNSIIAPSRVHSYRELSVSVLYGAGSNVTLPLTHYQISAIGAIWFLLAFFIGTQLFNFVMSMAIPKNGLLIKGIIVALLTFMGTYLQTYIYLPWSINAALFAQIFFFSGYIIKKFELLSYGGRTPLCASVILWMATATIGLFGLDNVDFPNMYIAIIGGIASSYVVIRFSRFLDVKLKENIIERVLCFYGAESLSIFCFHLIDLDFIQIWPKVVYHCNQLIPYCGAITVGILYRIAFVTVITLIIPYVPIVRSIYMHRTFKFKR